MADREKVLRLMQEETIRLNELALFAEQAGMPGSAAKLMQAATGIERMAALERKAMEQAGRPYYLTRYGLMTLSCTDSVAGD